MDNTEARGWAKNFENKDKSQLLAMPFPEGLDTDAMEAWWLARSDAIEALDDAEDAAAEMPDVSSSEEEKSEFDSADGAQNLRERIAAAIAHNNEPVPEPVFQPLQAPVILQRTPPLEAMEIQLSSSASMVEGITRQFREQDFSASLTCEIMKSMAVLIAANAALGKVVYHFQNDAMNTGVSGRGSNAS